MAGLNTIVCFGELLLRFTPSLPTTWITSAHMPVYIGGAELNVARALQRWGHSCRYVSAMPENNLADGILSFLQAEKLDIAQVLRTGDRLGCYFLPRGTDLKQGGVIYDRAHSAFAGLQPGQIAWHEALKGAGWMHVSAIIPALSKQAAAVCLEAMHAAKALGLTISLDLNHRSSLWQYGQHPHQVMPPFVQLADVVMGNLWAAESLLGIASPLNSSEGVSTNDLIAAAEQSIYTLRETYINLQQVAYTFRLPQHYFGVLHHHALVVSPIKPLQHVVDKVGSGDCFMAGLIHGITNGLAAEKTIAFAAAAAVNKLGEAGDATQTSETDIWKNA